MHDPPMLTTLPILRAGRVYESLDTVDLLDYRTQQPVAKIGQANPGIIKRDARQFAESAAILRKLSVAQIMSLCAKAGELFTTATLPLYPGGPTQSPEQYVASLSSTTGLPVALVRRNMDKIAFVLSNTATIIRGLTRGLDTSIIDTGIGTQSGVTVSYYPTTDALGLVLPSNSPGVNSIWLPALPLRVPVVLKPGREEPWTPLRLIMSLITAGLPPQAFSFYPTSHEGAQEVLNHCSRGVIFGDANTVERYASDPRISVHGPGMSKVIIGNDQIENWPELIDVLAGSVADNGGRSCINASTILVPKYADEIALALAKKLVQITPRASDDPEARLAGFANPKFAQSIDAVIDQGLAVPGATDVTAPLRTGPRCVSLDGSTFLQPTVVRCDTITHPLGNKEFLFPFVSVIQTSQENMLAQIGPSLVVAVITHDPAFTTHALACPLIARLNLGPVPTSRVDWDQPHEGNLFEFLYRRRAIMRSSA
jgi:acyl-CoA reductase-like NAD-dependent aldehyde dehydrogenase